MPEHHPRLNHLLAALPPEVYSRLLPHLEYIELPLARCYMDLVTPCVMSISPSTASSPCSM